MEQSMITRLTWSTFAGSCLQTAQDLFLVAERPAFEAKAKKNYHLVIDAMKEEMANSVNMVSALCASTFMSLDSRPEKEQMDQFYNRVFGKGNCPEGVLEMLSQFQ